MSVYRRRLTCAVLALSIAALALGGAGVRINTSKSIPVGIYWLSSAPITLNAYVIYCPPPTPVFVMARERGYIDVGSCPGKLGRMMKRILAAKFDHIAVSSIGVAVNGKFVSNSAPLMRDQHGQAMPIYKHASYTLQSDELLLMSGMSATSFDGRYFGPIKLSQIEGVIKPILVW